MKYLTIALIFLSACGGVYPQDVEGIDSIKVGMTKDEVKSAIGSPDTIIGPVWHYCFIPEGVPFQVEFLDDKVKGYATNAGTCF